MAPRGTSMVGVGRTVQGADLVEHELVVIREQGDRLAYEAHPSGQPPATFLSETVTDASVVFQNPQHDFPKRVGYERSGQDALVAWIDAGPDSERPRQEFPYRRVACEADDRARVTPAIPEAVLSEAGQKTAEVSTAELRRILAEGTANLFDARPFAEYAVSHIPGARNVAAKPGVAMSLYVSDVAEIGRVLAGVKGAPIVLYCNGPFCGKSKRLADELLAAGFTNVRRYQLGIPVWRALGGVTEIEPAGLRRVLADDRTAGAHRRARAGRRPPLSAGRGARHPPQPGPGREGHGRGEAGQGRRPAAHGGPQHAPHRRGPEGGRRAVCGGGAGPRSVPQRLVLSRGRSRRRGPRSRPRAAGA
jgi:rhodanese-related sulfurtransferase